MSTNPDLGSKAIGLVHVRKNRTELPYDPQREREIVATPGNQRERVRGLVDGWTQTGKNRGADD